MHYVIGDVHGCFKELKLLLNKIESQDPEAIIYFVGDWVDRGPEVAEVMQWVVDNITTTGKYRSVRGNHDQLAVDWYEQDLLPWSKGEHAPEEKYPVSYYGFSYVAYRDYNHDPKALEPFIEKIKEMPYNIALEITTESGAKINYRICHAWHYASNDLICEISEEDIIESNLWERNYLGYNNGDEIIVHGHTPTVLTDYRLKGYCKDRPGLIGYRHNDIDVDGGCCLQDKFPYCACMLCGICLETLEEFYSHTLEERLMETRKIRYEDYISRCIKDVSEDEIKGYLDEQFQARIDYYKKKGVSEFRLEMLDRLK